MPGSIHRKPKRWRLECTPAYRPRPGLEKNTCLGKDLDKRFNARGAGFQPDRQLSTAEQPNSI